MGQVVNNIVINARQAMQKGGIVRISATNVDGATVKTPPIGKIQVQYASPWQIPGRIPENHLPHIFDPYFTTKPNGTGLGLTTSFSIISQPRWGISM
jgi:signal transduction histidine kinase